MEYHEKGNVLTRSKLERYLNILEVLVFRPLEFENILRQVDESWSILKKYLDFLIVQGLIERLPLGEGRVVYTVTEKGFSVLRALQERECLTEYTDLMLLLGE